MNRKMRALKANKEARAKRDRPRSGQETGNALFVDRNGSELFRAPVLVDHDERTVELIPDKSEMN